MLRGLVFFIFLGVLSESAFAVSFEDAALRLRVAEVTPSDREIAKFYRRHGYPLIWVGSGEKSRARRVALLDALAHASDHGLPAERYSVDKAREILEAAKTLEDKARADLELTHIFIDYARDMKVGVVNPKRVDKSIGHRRSAFSTAKILTEVLEMPAPIFFRSLMPQSADYAALLKEKIRLEKIISKGSWGEDIPEGLYVLGDRGEAIVLLRNRLMDLGFLKNSTAKTYDRQMDFAVRAFQKAHDLSVDGVVGKNTINALNVSPKERLGQILAALERRRWMNKAFPDHYIWVNLAAARVSIIRDGKPYFTTRAVVGDVQESHQSAEFSDVMTYMVLNPTWNVPRSIATEEYLPILQKNPFALSHIEILDVKGQFVERSEIDFTLFSEMYFPFSLHQKPSLKNALGRVKFMFPNKYNIYLHDTPKKKLFYLQNRNFSHGCIRLHRPYEFAYALLGGQGDLEIMEFHKILDTGVETQINLKTPVPIHLVYRTVTVTPSGQVVYRPDSYGRDTKLIAAMHKIGVTVPQIDVALPEIDA